MVDLYCASYAAPPRGVALDIDDTVDVVHGRQQLSLFNAHHDERCFLPIHVYDTAAGRPVAMILRPGKTPSGVEVRGHLRRLVRAIRQHWPATRITIRGDGHYGRPEVMDFCEANGIDYVFGLTGTRRWPPRWKRRPMRSASSAPSKTRTRCAALPRPRMPPSPGASSAGSPPASRPPAWASTSAMS